MGEHAGACVKGFCGSVLEIAHITLFTFLWLELRLMAVSNCREAGKFDLACVQEEEENMDFGKQLVVSVIGAYQKW